MNEVVHSFKKRSRLAAQLDYYYQISARKGEGLTLIELLIALSILIVIFSLGLWVSFDFYNQYLISAERNNVVSVLRRARSEAVNNIGESSHGAYLAVSQYTVFEGSSYAGRNQTYDENFPGSSGIVISGPNEIVFSLDGSSSASGTIAISNGVKNFSISINNEGEIDY